MPGIQRTPVEVRVWRRISKAGPNDCWIWTGVTNRGPNTRGGPYGTIGSGGKYGRHVYVHRVVYEAEVGPIPQGWHVDHLCKTPLCCNPRHLEAVPASVNNVRSTSPTSVNALKTHCPQGHAYTPRNTGYRKGTAWRYCRTCAREAQFWRRRGSTYTEWREKHA